MSILTTADLRANSRIDPHDRNPYAPCWHWLGAKSNGYPSIWTLDYDRVEKRTMRGVRAVVSISRGRGLGKSIAYRTCSSACCVNPSHHATANSRSEMMSAVARLGRYKDLGKPNRIENLRKAWAMSGHELTPPDVVRACRAADDLVSNATLARQFGMHQSTVRLIRRGMSHKGVA